MSRKKSVGGDGSNQHTEEQLCQSGIIANNQESTSEIVARETGVRGAEKSGQSGHSLENDQRAGRINSAILAGLKIPNFISIRRTDRPEGSDTQKRMNAKVAINLKKSPPS